MKKVFSMLLAVAVIVSLCLVSMATVFADGDPTLTIASGAASAKPGDTVNVAIGIANNPGIISLRIKITYDESALQLLEDIQDTELLKTLTTPSPDIASPYILRWADALATENNTANGDVVKLSFKVKDGAMGGQYPISVECVESRTTTGQRLTFATAQLAVSVDGPTAAPETAAPTDAPTNAPTDAPTNAPTDVPENTAQASETEAPEVTAAPEATTEPKSSGCGNIIGSASAVAFLAAAVVIARKRREKR